MSETSKRPVIYFHLKTKWEFPTPAFHGPPSPQVGETLTLRLPARDIRMVSCAFRSLLGGDSLDILSPMEMEMDDPWGMLMDRNEEGWDFNSQVQIKLRLDSKRTEYSITGWAVFLFRRLSMTGWFVCPQPYEDRMRHLETANCTRLHMFDVNGLKYPATIGMYVYKNNDHKSIYCTLKNVHAYTTHTFDNMHSIKPMHIACAFNQSWPKVWLLISQEYPRMILLF